jgi:uncharacterized protein YyaL (SSP411 family)
MKNRFLFCFLLLFFLLSCSSESGNRKRGQPNALIGESSPYLLQHADNPVDWYPWKDATLEKAKKEEKILIISIGYASCHWCHVMERETFMDEEVAEMMNAHFINIKVDREERPDVDQVYLNALQLISGSGGWPLNAFALPDGRPFFATTYLTTSQWKDLLGRILSMKEENYKALEEGAEQILMGISASEVVNRFSIPAAYPDSLLLLHNSNHFSLLDMEMGGYHYEPKFFYAPGMDYLRYASLASANAQESSLVSSSLRAFWKGGVYDHVGGGFSRYATDKEWNIPHFEKMLYDNAQLMSLYAKAYRTHEDPLYALIVEGIYSFLKQLETPQGAYYSSMDAESEGEEGAYYLWEVSDLTRILSPQEFEKLSSFFSIQEGGNWEGRGNVLYLSSSAKSFTSVEEYLALDTLFHKLERARLKRVAPKIDDKIITSWNALMAIGLLDAYRSFGEQRYLDQAQKVLSFVLENRIDNQGKLIRSSKTGKDAIPAFLDDYAHLVRACIEMYQVTFDQIWLSKALSLQEMTNQSFYDEGTGMYFYAPQTEKSLVVRKFEIMDNVMPSPNGTVALNLLLLGDLFEKEEYVDKARQMMANCISDLEEGGPFVAAWAQLYAYFAKGIQQIVIIGENWEEYRRILQAKDGGLSLYMGGEEEGTLPLMESKLQEGQTTVYICKDKICQLPVFSTRAALERMGVPVE